MKQCRSCGCRDFLACVAWRDDKIFTCSWVEDDLCLFCALGVSAEGWTVVRGVDTIQIAGAVL